MFISNVPLVLSKIECMKITVMNCNASSIELSLLIPENNVSKVLFNKFMVMWHGSVPHQLKVTFPRPVIIEPHKIYKISFKYSKSITYNSDTSPTLSLDDGVTVSFLKNPFNAIYFKFFILLLIFVHSL